MRVDKIGVLLGGKERAEMIAGSCERAVAEVEQIVVGRVPVHLTSES